MMSSTPFIRCISLLREKVKSFDDYPFSVPAVRALDEMVPHPQVTFFVGENGSGKSTLLEGIAVAMGFNAEGGTKNFNFSTHVSGSALSNHLRIAKGIEPPKSGFFLRAESFFNVATEIEHRGVNGAYGGTSLHEQSHGESFMALLMNRFGGKGLYLLDETEAALSPGRQLAVLARIRDLVCDGCQFIIATHSPILMAYPGAAIFEFGADGIAPIAYEDTGHYRVTRAFLNNPARMLSELMRD